MSISAPRFIRIFTSRIESFQGVFARKLGRNKRDFYSPASRIMSVREKSDL
jgi:hypothetical protein